MREEGWIEKVDEQIAFRMFFDFMDTFGPDIRVYNVCRAKTGYDQSTGCACSCGLAFPNKLWLQPDPNTWKFKCKLDWRNLVKAQAANP